MVPVLKSIFDIIMDNVISVKHCICAVFNFFFKKFFSISGGKKRYPQLHVDYVDKRLLSDSFFHVSTFCGKPVDNALFTPFVRWFFPFLSFFRKKAASLYSHIPNNAYDGCVFVYDRLEYRYFCGMSVFIFRGAVCLYQINRLSIRSAPLLKR